MNLIILGAPGSGKGTQAEFLAQKLGLDHISTGKMFRREVASGSRFGQEIKRYLDTGELVPDDILFSILEKIPLKEGQGFILDGTPRNLEQTDKLDEVLTRIGVTLDKVIFLDVPRQTCTDRLLNRAHLEHRSDDNLQTIEERLDIYQQDTVPVIDFYRKRDLLLTIDGRPDPKTIFKNICTRLGVE